MEIGLSCHSEGKFSRFLFWTVRFSIAHSAQFSQSPIFLIRCLYLRISTCGFIVTFPTLDVHCQVGMISAKMDVDTVESLQVLTLPLYFF